MKLCACVLCTSCIACKRLCLLVSYFELSAGEIYNALSTNEVLDCDACVCVLSCCILRYYSKAALAYLVKLLAAEHASNGHLDFVCLSPG
jgi:hypothetical protein